MKIMVKRIMGLICVLLCFAILGTDSEAATDKRIKSVSVMYLGKTKAANQKVISNSHSIISVKRSGEKYLLIPQKTGETVLKYYKGKKLIKQVSVLVLGKNAIQYNSEPLAMEIGMSKIVRAKKPEKCIVSYSSNNPRIASVSKKGRITAKTKGSCTITAKITYKGRKIKTYKKKITVTAATGKDLKKPSSNVKQDTEKYVRLVTFTLKSNSVMVGEKLSNDQITVTATYSDGSEVQVSDFKHDFTPKDSAGSYQVYVTWKNFSKKFVIHVRNVDRIMSFTAEYARNYIFSDEKPDKGDIKVTANYSNGNSVAISDFTYDYIPAKKHKEEAAIVIHIKNYNDIRLNILSLIRSEPAELNVHISNIYVNIGEDINRDNLEVIVKDYAGDTKEITDYKLSYTPKIEAGVYPVILTYHGLQVEFKVKVK